MNKISPKNGKSLLEAYETFKEDTTNNDYYYNFLNEFLKYFKLLPSDFYGENYKF